MSEIKKLAKDEIPDDVLDRMKSGHTKGRARSALRQAMDAMMPGDVLDTGLEAGTGRNARKVRAMIDSLRIAGNTQKYSVMQSHELGHVLVWCHNEPGDDEDKRADEQLARDNGEWEEA